MSKPGVHAHPRGGHEVVTDAVHVGPGHRPRRRHPGRVTHRRRPDRLPAVLPQRDVGAFPGQLHRTLRPGMPELQADPRGAVLVHEATMRRHAATCSARYMPVHPSVMRASGDTHVISVITRPAPPSARVPRCTRWKSPGIPSTALYMSIGATTTRLGTVMPRSENGVNIGTGGACRPRCSGREPPLHAFQVAAVAQPQVLVADPLTARQQRVGELVGGQPDVALDVLEPLHRVAGGILQPERLGHPLLLILVERLGQRLRAGQHARQRDGVLHGELGARADREMRGVRGVADEDEPVVEPRALRTRTKLVHGGAVGAAFDLSR